jgi:hypothetical protein
MKFITWGERLGRVECPYMCRWVVNFKLFSLRLHHWYYGDDERNFHDHSWWFVTFIIRGSYTDISENGSELLTAGSIRFRCANYKHTVQVSKGGCWSFLITGPIARSWGFWVDNKFMKANKYFLKWGQHQCKD